MYSEVSRATRSFISFCALTRTSSRSTLQTRPSRGRQNCGHCSSPSTAAGRCAQAVSCHRLRRSCGPQPRWGDRQSASPTRAYSLKISVTTSQTPPRLARTVILSLFDLRIFKFNRRGSSEDRNSHFKPRPLFIYVFDKTAKRGKRTITDAYALADLKCD